MITIHEKDDLEQHSLYQFASKLGSLARQTLHLRNAFLSSSRSCGRDDVSTMVVDTLSGVPRVGGRVIGGNTACILVVMKASLTNDVSNELLPVASSPYG